jgi:hypothetical protein
VVPAWGWGVTILDDITKQAQESLALAERASGVLVSGELMSSQPGTFVAGWVKVGDDDETCIVAKRREDAAFIVHASTALPDHAKAWLAVQEALEELSGTECYHCADTVADIRAAILRRLSK